MSRLFDFLIARPKSTLLAVLTVTALVGLGTLRLRIDFSPEQVYVGQDDAVAFCENHKRLFRFEDSIALVVLESTDTDGTLLREDCLLWMKEFAARSERLPGVRNVTSIVTLERPRISLRGNERVTWAEWLPSQSYSDTADIARRLEQIPLLNDTLVSRDHRMMMTLIDLDPAGRAITTALKRVTAIQDTIDELPLPESTSTFVTGVPAIRTDVVTCIQQDQMQMFPTCCALFLLLSLLMFRSIVVTTLSLLAGLASVILTTGLMGWTGITFSVMSNAVPALLLIIGAANIVHIVTRFQVEVLQSGRNLKACAKATMLEMSHTCFLTLATSGVGFGSLLVARAELLQSLAVQASVGMACCYVSLMLMMPQILTICGPLLTRRSGPRRAPDSEVSVGGVAGMAASGVNSSGGKSAWYGFGTLISRYAVAIVVVHLLLAAWTLWSCRNLAINSYMFETFEGDHPTMDAVRKMDEQMSGLISLEVQLRVKDRDRLFDADLAAALARLRDQVPQDDRITFYRDYIEFLSVYDHGRTLDQDPSAAAASLKRVRLALRQLDNSEVTSAFLGKSEPVARVMMRLRDVGSVGMKDLFVKVSGMLQRELPPDVQFRLTGDAWLHAYCMDSFVRDLFYSLLTASGVIFFLITLLFRSLRIGLISAVPNMLPLVMTLGYIHLRGYELTAGNVIVFAISLGIAVDDTIHFLARYRDEQKSGTPLEAIQRTLFSSGRAIVLTSVMVVCGLSVLLYSDFVPTQRFAELTAITMCAALPGDIILLPALLKLFGGQRVRSAETAAEVSSDSVY